MWKSVLAGTAALAIAGSTLVHAQQGPGPGGPGGPKQQTQRWQPSAQDIEAMTDARVAALKAGLKLTAEQEKNWPAVESAIRDRAKARVARMQERRNAARPQDHVERLRRRAETMSARADELKKFADAVAPLYKSLDDSQKRRFAMLARADDRRGPGGRHHWRGRHHGPWNGPGGPGGPMMGPGGPAGPDGKQRL